MMQKDILFIDAACKSREKFLLGTDKYARLMDAGSFDEGLKLLREYGFGKSAPEGCTLSELIYAEEEGLIAFIKDYAPKGGAKYYFLLPYDFMNGEALFKCRKLGLEEEKYLTHEGSLAVSEIKSALDGKKCGIPELNDAFTEAEKLFEEGTPSGAMVDTVFSRFCYKAMHRLIKDKKAIEFIDREIDLKNLSVILRCESLEEYKSMKLPYGTLTSEQEAVLIGKDKTKIIEAFKRNTLYEFVLKAVDDIGNPLTEYEKLADSFNLLKLKETRFFNRGTEPYLLYVGYRKADIKNVRLIMVSLRSGVDKLVVKSKLREGYQA